jgi:hypothetical protein
MLLRREACFTVNTATAATGAQYSDDDRDDVAAHV